MTQLAGRTAALTKSMQFISSLGVADAAACSALAADDILYVCPRDSEPIQGSSRFFDSISELVLPNSVPGTPSNISLETRELSDSSWLVYAQFDYVWRGPSTHNSMHVTMTMTWVTEESADGETELKLAGCHGSVIGDYPTSDGTVAAVAQAVNTRGAARSYADAGNAARSSGERDKVALQARDSSGSTHWIQPKSVVYVEAAHQYTNVHCRDRTLRLRTSFSTVVEQLGGAVIKVHRSYAVNPAYVSCLENEMLYLSTGDKVPVPAKRVHAVRLALADRFAQLGVRS